MPLLGNVINGTHVASESGNIRDIFNPATGQAVRQVSLATEQEALSAIDAADKAFQSWSKVTPLRRARVMFKFKALVEENASEIAKLISEEHGKHLLKGEHSLNVGTGIDSFSLMQPVGVCAGITPFNFPAMVPLWMFPVAIACGNTFILKPSEKVPSASLKMAELLKEAGLPDGVFNIVNGDKLAVDTLLTDDRVKAVSFVGSTPIAEYIYRTGSAHGKRVQALGGAKNHMVIMPDADLEQVANALIGAAYGSAGERCMAISVAVCVGDAVADKLIKIMCEKIDEMLVGPASQTPDEPHMGPLVSSEHAAKVRGYIDVGVEEGATLVKDGRDFVSKGNEQGYFVGPTLFDNVTTDMRIHKEEIFGPVLSVMRSKSFDDAVKMINEHEYGNGTSIYTRDGSSARRYCEQIEVGMVGVNVPIPVPMAFHCFGDNVIELCKGG